MSKKNGTSATEVLELPCQYGDVSFGDTKAAITLSIDRRQLKITKADAVLCGKRLTVHLTAQEDGADPDQGALDGMDSTLAMDAVVDVRSFRVTAKAISTRLTFAIESIEASALIGFAKRSGKLIVDSVESIPDKDGGGEEDDDKDDAA